MAAVLNGCTYGESGCSVPPTLRDQDCFKETLWGVMWISSRAGASYAEAEDLNADVPGLIPGPWPFAACPPLLPVQLLTK